MLVFKPIVSDDEYVSEEYEISNESDNVIGWLFFVEGGGWIFQEKLYTVARSVTSSVMVDDLAEIVEFTKKAAVLR